MPNRNRPQNPIFPVDPMVLASCLPKAVCAACGIVMPLRNPQHLQIIRCRDCSARLIVENAGEDGWTCRVAPAEGTA